MIRCLRTTRSARARPASVRSASLCSPRSISPSASSRFSISPADARETPSISATRAASVGDPDGQRPVLADREREEVDRLEVLVDGMPLRHSAHPTAARPSAFPYATCQVTLTTEGRMRLRATLGAGIAALVLVGAGCGGDDDGERVRNIGEETGDRHDGHRDDRHDGSGHERHRDDGDGVRVGHDDLRVSVRGRRADLVVLGAGPAGVGAAYRAARAGARVVVLERAPVPGRRRPGSFEVAGVRVDHGSHRLHPSVDPAMLAELRALLGPDLQRRRRDGRIRLDGRWIAFPLRAGDLVRRLPPAVRARRRARRAALAVPPRRARRHVRRGRARRARPDPRRALLLPVRAEALGARAGADRRRAGPAPRLGRHSGEAAAPRRSAATRTKAAGSGTRAAATARSPRRSRPRAAAAGAELRYGATVTRVEAAGRTAVASRSSAASRSRPSAVWSTMPVHGARRSPSRRRRPTARRGRDELDFRAMLLVYLVLDVDRYTPFDAHYLPEAWTPVTRVSEPKNYRDGDDPPGRTVLCAEIPCAPRRRALDAARTTSSARVVARHARRGRPARPAAGRASRCGGSRPSYPVYRVGYARALRRLDAWATAQPRLLTFGRRGLFVARQHAPRARDGVGGRRRARPRRHLRRRRVGATRGARFARARRRGLGLRAFSSRWTAGRTRRR